MTSRSARGDTVGIGRTVQTRLFSLPPPPLHPPLPDHLYEIASRIENTRKIQVWDRVRIFNPRHRSFKESMPCEKSNPFCGIDS
jgi:hypothetical protein